MKKALLALADGTIFEGRALGYEGETMGEVVFNTAMTGYQEVLTDPSYKGQIITMTSPHIGNYGMTPEDVESRRVWAEGFIVKEASRLASNWRSRQQLQDYLHEAKIVAIEGLDTRALTRHLREHGSQQGLITHVDADAPPGRREGEGRPPASLAVIWRQPLPVRRPIGGRKDRASGFPRSATRLGSLRPGAGMSSPMISG